MAREGAHIAFEPHHGDLNWNLQCGGYARTLYALALLAQEVEWFRLWRNGKRSRGLAHVAWIDDVPFRVYRVESPGEVTPKKYREPASYETQVARLPLFERIGGGTAEHGILYRLRLCGGLDEPLASAFFERREFPDGQVTSWSIPIPAVAAAAAAPPAPIAPGGVKLAPAIVRRRVRIQRKRAASDDE